MELNKVKEILQKYLETYKEELNQNRNAGIVDEDMERLFYSLDEVICFLDTEIENENELEEWNSYYYSSRGV